MKKSSNTWTMLGLSLILGPVMIFYWIYEYFRGWFVEPGIHKGIRVMGIADLGKVLSLTSTIIWFVLIATLL